MKITIGSETFHRSLAFLPAPPLLFSPGPAHVYCVSYVCDEEEKEDFEHA